jgi:hypothetical protein
MQILVFFLAILIVASIIVISMIGFRVAVASLLKINSLEKEIIEIKNKKNHVKKL